jgi:hypothetical protein
MNTLELQAYYSSRLAEQYGQMPRLSKYDAEIRMNFARGTIAGAWPIIVDLPDTENGARCIQITPTVTTNILNCVIGGDTNYQMHTGHDATAQTGTLVNAVCGVAVAHLVGGVLTSINPFGFRRSLPIGESAIITLVPPKKGQQRAKVLMEGFLHSTGQQLFKPANITLVNIPT